MLAAAGKSCFKYYTLWLTADEPQGFILVAIAASSTHNHNEGYAQSIWLHWHVLLLLSSLRYYHNIS